MAALSSSRSEGLPGRTVAVAVGLTVAVLAGTLGGNPTPAFAVEPHPGEDHRLEHHPDVELRLWAAEPLVVDPVALSFAADGSCYVVEMRDYPYGVDPGRRPGGTIRRLRDTDGDGLADEATLFADGLSFPTSVMAWQDGVLVLAPPELIYLADRDGDGIADVRTVLVDGFHLGVTDSNANGLRFGLDGLVHGANGGNGGALRFTAEEAAERVALGRADFALDFRRREVRRTFHTAGGFGLVFDDSGRRFSTFNIDYLQHQVVAAAQAEAATDVRPFDATLNISDHGPSARLFPIVQAVTRLNHPEQAGRFSSAGGMGILDGEPFSPRLARSVFVCDVACNVVHRDVLRDDGPVVRAGRAPEEQDREFIASADPAFRPVGLEQGPDGALYLIDMQRDVIEHPDYIPKRTRAGLDIRAGQDRGRIYRVVPRVRCPIGWGHEDGVPLPPPAELTSLQLAEELAGPGRWRRETAHRLLLERAAAEGLDSEVTARITRLARVTGGSSPDGRIRALWLLLRLGQLGDDDLFVAATDPDPAVRSTVVTLLSEPSDRDATNATAFTEARRSRNDELLVRLLYDPAPRVRFAALLALDGLEPPGKQDGLLRVVEGDLEHAWCRRGLALAADDHAPALLARAWDLACSEAPSSAEKPRPGRLELVEELGFTAASAAGPRSDQLMAFLAAVDWDAAPPALATALLESLTAAWMVHPQARPEPEQLAPRLEGWARRLGRNATMSLLALAAKAGIAPPESVRAEIEAAEDLLSSPVPADSDPADRLRAVELLAMAGGDRPAELLPMLLERPETAAVQRAVIEGLVRMDRADLSARLVAAWPRIMPAARGLVLDRLVWSAAGREALVAGLESGALRPGELNLDLEQRRSLVRWSNPALALRARRFIADEEYANRRTVVDEWLARLPEQGDSIAGRRVFEARCATCHVAHGLGHRVGPDLEALAHRSVEDLVSHILDPNMAINPNYVACVVETDDGRVHTGLVAVDAPETLTLLQPEARRVTLPRATIATVRLLDTSLMPEGLEKDLTPEELRGLIAFVQSAPVDRSASGEPADR